MYVTISNPCIVASGGAITPASITALNYWIKDSTLFGESYDYRSVPYFADAPTTADGGNTYLYANGNNLCGSKSYEIVDADKNAIVYYDSGNNFVYEWMKFFDDTSKWQIKLATSDPSYYTNADITYYVKVTLDDYVYRYPDEAVYYESFTVNLKNCQVSSYTKDVDASYYYNIYTPVHKYSYTAFSP